MQVSKAQTLELHKTSLLRLQQESQDKLQRIFDTQFEDLQTDLENFRSTARTLQIAWAQESPYVPDEDDAVADTQAPMVEADDPLSPQTPPARGYQTAATAPAPTSSIPPPAQAKRPYVNRLFPHVDMEAILNGPRPPARPPVFSDHSRPHDRSSAPPPLRSPAPPAGDTGGRPVDPEDQLTRLRNATPSIQLRGTVRKDVIAFYNSFVDFLKNFRVPIRIFDDLNLDGLEDLTEHVYPAESDSSSYLHGRYSAAIYSRLEEGHVLDPSEPIYAGLMEMHNSTRDGYELLRSLLTATLAMDAKDISTISTPPTWSPGSSAYAYGARLLDFFRSQQRLQRDFTDREQASMYLHNMQADPQYAPTVVHILHDIGQLPADARLPPKYILPQLALTLSGHQSQMRGRQQPAT